MVGRGAWAPAVVPATWAVTYDAGYEGWITGDEDLFQATHSGHGLLVDVGWYPAENPHGRFRVALVRDGDWDASTILAETQDVDAVLAALRDAVRTLQSGSEQLSTVILEAESADELSSGLGALGDVLAENAEATLLVDEYTRAECDIVLADSRRDSPCRHRR